jgi:8-oxo-dGTP pyrophosphatase MutT (NUDIX family)
VSSPPPWRRVSRGPERDYTILKVREDQVEDPRNGSLHPRVLIDAADWVNIIPVTPDGKVVLIRQFRFGVWAPTLEIPGGVVDPGEEPAAAAARELEEETGYRPGRLQPLGWVHPNPALQANRCHSFLGLDCAQAHGGRPESGEDIRVELRDRAEIPRLIRDGEITHSLVLTAFFLDDLTRR